MIGDLHPIIDDVRFDSVQYFDIVFLSGIVGIRETLCTRVIRDRNSRMTPFRRAFNVFRHVHDGVHLTHLRVRM